MAGMIEAKPIPGLAVYGVPQVEYFVAGSGDPVDYGAALALASLARADALEMQTAALSTAVRTRAGKCEDLGKCLAEIARIVASNVKKKITEEVPLTDELKAQLTRYGVELPKKDKLTKGDIQELEAKVRYEMDRESSQIKLDMSTVRNMFNTRDRAFQQASSIQKKVASGVTNTIKNMR